MTKYFSILPGAILLICLQTGCANESISAKSPPPKVAPAVQSQFPELKPGMTAETIRAKLGEPIEIRPMESKVGKSEVWVFHIERTINTTQIATGTKNLPVMGDATNDSLTTAPDMVYSLANKQAVTILSLLMINGRLIAQTSATGEHIEYK